MPLTGAVGSAQEAEAILPPGAPESLWGRGHLERLERGYWRFLTRISLGLIRVVRTPASRTVTLVTRRLPLISFRAPEYETSPHGGSVTWRIDRGLLVAREGRGRGHLRIDVRRLDPQLQPAGHRGGDAPPLRLHIRLEVRNFYPWLRGQGRFARFGTWLYGQTQLRVHRLVCNAYLRSLASLELPAPAGAPPNRCV